jgi:hypothetical protein
MILGEIVEDRVVVPVCQNNLADLDRRSAGFYECWRSAGWV